MVKGVHKKIIEVNHTGSDYFEKAVFYLKPGVSQLPPQIAETAAQMLLQQSDQPRSTAPQHARKRRILVFGIVSAGIVVLTVLLLRFLA